MWMSVGAFIFSEIDMGWSNGFFVIVKQRFNFFHFNKPVDLLGCELAEPILRSI